MKKLIIPIFIILIFLLPSIIFANETTEGYIKIKIPERTVIPVKLIQQLKGDQALIGQSVDFEVSRDIIIDDFIVIKRGAPTYATITSSEKAGYVSQGGKIGISMDYCKAIDGSKVYLRSILSKEAESHMGANIAASFILCPLILIAKGDEAEIPVGTEYKAYVENDVLVKVLSKDKLTDDDIQQIEQKEKEEKERKEKERIEGEERKKKEEKGRGEELQE